MRFQTNLDFSKESALFINSKIISFPDKSEFQDWQKKADELNKLGYQIKVSDHIEQLDFESGTDLADIYIHLKTQKPDFEELSFDEKNIISLAKTNPALLQLIETFDLLDSSDNLIDTEKFDRIINNKPKK